MIDDETLASMATEIATRMGRDVLAAFADDARAILDDPTLGELERGRKIRELLAQYGHPLVFQ